MPWFNGPVVTLEEAKKEFSGRKAKIDDEAAKRRAQK